MNENHISKNIEKIRQNINLACKESGRKADDIIILGVTKTIDAEDIKKAVDEGIYHLGENRVQEFLEKEDKIDNVKWHIIGHLQTNKVKYIIGKTFLIHSVESIKLAKEIDRLSSQKGITTDVLIEVNVSGEESKYGIRCEDIDSFLDEIDKFNAVKVKGFMTMAPKDAADNEIRQIFRKLYKIYVDISQKKYNNISMEYLSMGMSSDYELAILEGANIVRVGSAMFKQ
ncbi:MAG: YggS family pyridoxal phosphate-dependent enzyme [Ruminococcaceae bacterium]|nr:YggS family pyridoxal phosphate-dependent enzyme [Oscillospiraceae bacterium]